MSVVVLSVLMVTPDGVICVPSMQVKYILMQAYNRRYHDNYTLLHVPAIFMTLFATEVGEKQETAIPL